MLGEKKTFYNCIYPFKIFYDFFQIHQDAF